MAEIDKDFYFNLENNLSIEETQIALKAYYDNFEKALNLKTSIPIFLDTNILLKYYGMSQKDKSLLLEQFFNKKRELIHITRQIEKEYQRNRLTLIQKFFEQLELLKKNFHADLREGVKNKFNRTFESEILKKDFPEVLKIVKTIHEDLKVKLFDNEELFNKIDNNVDEILEENKFLEFKDPILDVYKMFHKVPSLSKNETDFLIEQYNKLIKDYKSKKEAVKWKYAFPGCGEKKDNDKYGDYIILHEIIKFMKENNSDAIFLTADVSKADWLKKNKEPFIHYIEKVYKLTGKTLYIFDATKIIDFISFEDIYDLSHDGNYSEDEHFDRVKNEKMIKLYQELKEQIFSLPKIKLKVNKYYLSFIANSNVVDIQIQQKALKLWINLRKGELKGGYEITQDVSNKGTLGNGDYVIQLKSNKNFDEVMEIIRQSYNKNA